MNVSTPPTVAESRRPFWILAVDGGGLRGAFSTHLLRRVEQEFDVALGAHFDLVAGTSTGSIIAAAIALGLPLDRVANLYEEHGRTIFTSRWWSARGYLASRYDAEKLKDVLDAEIGDRTMGSIGRPALIVPSVDVGNGQVHVLKSQYDARFCRDKEVRVADAVLASCSAPSFFSPHDVGVYRLADGGLWANNPSLVATIDAVRRFGIDIRDVRVLSIGTGLERLTYPRKRGPISCAWGLLTGWERGKLVELMLSLQSQSSTSMTTLLLGHAQVLRLNFYDENLPMDDPTAIADLRARADMLFTYHGEEIRSFLGAPARATTKEYDHACP